MNIYADVGFGFGKFLANNQEIIIPSISGVLSDSDFNIFASDSKSIEIEGLGAWTFSGNALLADHRRDYKWIFSPEYKAELLLGISRSISPNTHTLTTRVVTGLPNRDFERGKEFRAKFKNSLIGEYRITRNNRRQYIVISDVAVTSQMYAPIFYHLINNKSQFIRPETDMDSVIFGSVNVGSNTVEVGTIEISNLNSVIPNLDTLGQNASEPRGVFTLLPVLKSYLEEKFQGERFDDYEALEILQAGRVKLYNSVYSVDMNDLKSLYSENILKLCINTWGDRASRLFALILTGGGAHIIKPYFEAYHGNVVVSESSQWDIVRGYERLDKLISKRGKQDANND